MSLVARTPKSSLARSASIAFASRRAIDNHQVSCDAHRRSSTSTSTSQHAAGATKDTPETADSKKQASQEAAAQAKKTQIKKKTMAQLDEELRLKLEGISGDGGASGVEYENGKASGLKRNVKANMFRVI